MSHPIPARLADRPTQAGLVVPYISVVSEGRAYLGANHTTRLVQCVTRGLCQACGQRLARPMVIFAKDSQLPQRYSSEPPLHPECAAYSAAACPMLNARLAHYREHSRVDGLPCDRPGCDCAGWVPTDEPRTSLEVGDWSAVWVRDYAIAVNDKGEVHGVMWTGEPLKIRPVRRTA